MTEKLARLNAFFAAHPKAALAYSGGVDSVYLLYAGKAAGCDVRPYFVQTPFQPQSEIKDARELAAQIGVALQIIEEDILCHHQVRENPENRCYFCKRTLFSRLMEEAKQDGYQLVMDGSNASDDASDRPGMRALAELQVRSPLREAGLTKADIRALSKEAGLRTWDKPAYACLATRIPTGRVIEPELLQKVERAESALHELDFLDIRVRLYGEAARLQFQAKDMARAIEMREQILRLLRDDFEGVFLDLQGRA